MSAGGPPAFEQLQREQLRAAIRRTLEQTSGTPLQPSEGLNDELRTLQGLGLLPMWYSLADFRDVWAEVERELQLEIEASRASRRAL